MPSFITQWADWSNANQGVVSIALFVITILFGWITGIFDGLKRRPRFRIQILEGPSFCSTFPAGTKLNGPEAHRSAFAIYLHVTNVGSASGSIDHVHIGYHWHLQGPSLQWIRYVLGWFWLKQQTAAMDDFQVYIGKNIKIYPFLFQTSHISGTSSETFLQIGQSSNGVVYFEQSDSWGGCFPSVKNGVVKVKVRLIDAFGRAHSKVLLIPSVTPDEARKFNPAFGTTLSHLRGEFVASTEEGQVPTEMADI